ncbi:MAG: NADPH-dependent F420 reductase [Actinobacteria bacterium]|nr:NADPH-dependent F420 reductase [Actinomycetota bacterium]
MRVGILGGTGPAGRALAARLADAGVDVIIGSRSAERGEEVCVGLREKWAGRDFAELTGGDNEQAAGADVVVVATPWDSAATTAGSVAGRLEGKVVISMANALAKVGDEWEPLISPRGSVAASVAARLPGSYVAAAFQHLPARELGDLSRLLEADVLVCSDHAQALSTTMELVGRIAGLRGIEAGPLSNAASLESFVAVIREVNVRYKTHASLRLTGIPDEAVTPQG